MGIFGRWQMRVLLVVAGIVLALAGVRWVVVVRSAAEYRRFPSPGGNYEVVVYRRERFFPSIALMGQGGDGPGVVKLLDKRGEVLGAADVDSMISNVDTVSWDKQSVDVKLLASWPLPTPDLP